MPVTGEKLDPKPIRRVNTVNKRINICPVPDGLSEKVNQVSNAYENVQ
jgi:hypothetical protein